MKVNIGNYKRWIGPYQIAQALCFWTKYEVLEGYPDYVYNFGTWLAEDKNGNDSWLTKFCNWLDGERKRKIKIQIDDHDVWNLDHTLALIIHPALVKLKQHKQGAPYTDDEDVPEHLRSTNAKPKENDWDTDEFHFLRYEWILSELIWTFGTIADENHEGKFYKFPEDTKTKDFIEQIKSIEIDDEALKLHWERLNNGMRLFSKYYFSLWT